MLEILHARVQTKASVDLISFSWKFFTFSVHLRRLAWPWLVKLSWVGKLNGVVSIKLGIKLSLKNAKEYKKCTSTNNYNIRL